MTVLRRAALAVLLAGPAAAQTRTTSDLQTYLEAYNARGVLSGTLLVARGDSVLFEKSYGKPDYAGTARNATTSVFPIASVTKPLVSLMVRRLAERGIFSLQDSMAKWIPDFPQGTSIRIEHLVTHRSGLPHRVTTLEDEQRVQSPASMVQLAAKVPLAFAPGTRRLYSSTGYAVLMRVVELATGRPYAELLREYVLEPAHTTATFDVSEVARARAARQPMGYFEALGGRVAPPRLSLSFLAGGGSLLSTPRDLFRVVRAIQRGDLGEWARSAYPAIDWNGWSNGYRAFVDYDSTSALTVIFAGNVLSGSTDWIRRDVPLIVRGRAVPIPTIPAPAQFPLSSEKRTALTGTYDFGGRPQDLQFLDGSKALLGRDYLLYATSDSSFFAPQDYADVAILREGGRITGLRWTQGTTSFAIPRQD